MKKKLYAFIITLSIFSKLFCTESAVPETTEGTVSETVTDTGATSENADVTKKEFPVNFYLTFEPSLILNTDSGENSAVSPVVYPVSFGAMFFGNKPVTFQPRLSFFANYYLWYDGEAYPAEIENRTATVFHFLLDLPAVYRFTLKDRHSFEFGLGPAFDFTVTVLSHGVTGSDSGYTGSADSDTGEIRWSFWKNGRFIYITTQTAYLFNFSKKLSFGPEFRFYLPCGHLFSGDGFNHSIFSLGAKIQF